MAEQEQTASGTAVAIQSARDTNISTGIGSEEMKQILNAMAQQIPKYAAIAESIVASRLSEFEKRILEQFASSQNADATAFQDPDFQYLLGRAQHSYARSGDTVSRDTLIDLIAKRSQQKDRNRLTLTLNQAVETASVLTENEFAELSLVYLWAYTVNNGISKLSELIEYFNKYSGKLVDSVSEHASSYSYLVAQSCCTISMGSRDLRQLVIDNYGGLLNKGFTRDELIAHLPREKANIFDGTDIIIRSIHTHGHLQINAMKRKIYDEKIKASGISLSADEASNVWNLFASKALNESEIREKLRPQAPCVDKLFDLWSSTPIHRMELTALGIAIGYANLARISDFEADLKIWIE